MKKPTKKNREEKKFPVPSSDPTIVHCTILGRILSVVAWLPHSLALLILLISSFCFLRKRFRFRSPSKRGKMQRENHPKDSTDVQSLLAAANEKASTDPFGALELAVQDRSLPFTALY